MSASMIEQLQAAKEIYAASEGADLTPFDNLTTTYSDVEQGFQIRLAEKDELITALQAEIARLKSVNYDLMTAAAAPGDEDGDGISDEDDPEDDRPEGEAKVADIMENS